MSHSAAVPAHHTPGTGPSPASGTTPAGGRRAAAPMISVRDLTKTFTQGSRTVEALRGVSLDVPAGSIHGIIGHSGAGKSTLVRCLTMLEKPTSGAVEVNGLDLASVSAGDLLKARRRIGMVFQHANLFHSRTVRDNVAYPLEVTGAKAAARRTRADELLALVGLEGFADSYPAQLSGGQRQRVGIARALASDPDVLLCDEPTSALDPSTTDGILDLIADLSSRLGLTVLVITHEMHVVKRLCHSVSLLDAGRIVESGDLASVAADLDSRLSSALLPLPASALAHGGLLLETLATGEAAAVPVSRLVERGAGADVELLAGSVEDLAGCRFAHHLLRLPDTVDPDSVIADLQPHGVRARLRTRAELADAQSHADDFGGAQ